uniref:Uncharacterized protein n=1 Tax=Myotis myotis TaxID=51298 RepID=A0A7J7ZWN6_MYOMY|nr:hypothetical protein mMyoMyo1_009643 [Myotis myotis]
MFCLSSQPLTMLFPLPGSLPQSPLPNATFQAPPLPPSSPRKHPSFSPPAPFVTFFCRTVHSVPELLVSGIRLSHWAQSCLRAGPGADCSVSPFSIEVDEERRKRDGMITVYPEDGGETEAGIQRNSHKSGECFTQKGSRQWTRTTGG